MVMVRVSVMVALNSRISAHQLSVSHLHIYIHIHMHIHISDSVSVRASVGVYLFIINKLVLGFELAS